MTRLSDQTVLSTSLEHLTWSHLQILSKFIVCMLKDGNPFIQNHLIIAGNKDMMFYKTNVLRVEDSLDYVSYSVGFRNFRLCKGESAFSDLYLTE